MLVKFGSDKTKYGPGVDIELTGDELATAIDAYLVAHDINVFGPRTIKVNGELCQKARVYVDPSGYVIHDGEKYDGRGDDSYPKYMIRSDDQEVFVHNGNGTYSNKSMLEDYPAFCANVYWYFTLKNHNFIPKDSLDD